MHKYYLGYLLMSLLAIHCKTTINKPMNSTVKNATPSHTGQYLKLPQPLVENRPGIKQVKIQVKGGGISCLGYWGPNYMLDTYWYNHPVGHKEPNKNFQIEHCDAEWAQPYLRWFQVEVLPDQYAYVKIARAPFHPNNDNDSSWSTSETKWVIMGLLYHSKDALIHEPDFWGDKEEEEETFLGKAKYIMEPLAIDPNDIDPKSFTDILHNVVVNQVYWPKTQPEKFHHFQGPFL